MKRRSFRSPVRIPNGLARIVTLAELRDCPAWHEAFRDDCKDHRFYELIGTSLTESFDYFFLILEDDEQHVRAIQQERLGR